MPRPPVLGTSGCECPQQGMGLVFTCILFLGGGGCGWAIENQRGLLANGRVELYFLSSFPCARGGGGGSEGWVSVGFPGHPPPPPFVPVIYKAPLRDDLGQYAASLFVDTRKKCGPEPPPPFSLLRSLPPCLLSSLSWSGLAPTRLETIQTPLDKWLVDNTNRWPHLAKWVYFLEDQNFAGVFKVST